MVSFTEMRKTGWKEYILIDVDFSIGYVKFEEFVDVFTRQVDCITITPRRLG